VQLPLPEFLENSTTPESGPGWDALDAEPRAMVVALVARLIAKIVVPHLRPSAAAEEETDRA